MRRIILECFLSPGDIVMLTAAVRDLHLCYPGQFETDVRTPCPDLWAYNPHITPLNENDSTVEVIKCHYPLIHQSNFLPYHFIHGFIQYLNERLDLNIRPTAFKGDIPISSEEKDLFCNVEESQGGGMRYWLINAGGKTDFTIKWWPLERYQKIVDYFQGKIEFVQVGEGGHHHPPLRGVIDLRGETSLRQLVRLVYNADGALTGVSLLMHLVAAIETRPGMPPNRACVVPAGGREPSQWEAYPHHQFIHTLGMLRCCDNGGCWKSRTVALGDGSAMDDPAQLCVDVVCGSIPRCMDMITPEDVIRRIEGYYNGGALKYASG
jgi:hypothetical protein